VFVSLRKQRKPPAELLIMYGGAESFSFRSPNAADNDKAANRLYSYLGMSEEISTAEDASRIQYILQQVRAQYERFGI
jgi:hypothetical protein